MESARTFARTDAAAAPDHAQARSFDASVGSDIPSHPTAQARRRVSPCLHSAEDSTRRRAPRPLHRPVVAQALRLDRMLAQRSFWIAALGLAAALWTAALYGD